MGRWSNNTDCLESRTWSSRGGSTNPLAAQHGFGIEQPPAGVTLFLVPGAALTRLRLAMEDLAPEDSDDAPVVDASRKLRIEAGESRARLAVAAFAMLDARAAALLTLEHSRRDREPGRLE